MKKHEDIYLKILQLLNELDSTEDQLILLANLTITLGSNLAGLAGQRVAPELLEQLNYQNPTLDLALMLQGHLMLTWLEDYKKHPELSGIGNKIRKESKE